MTLTSSELKNSPRSSFRFSTQRPRIVWMNFNEKREKISEKFVKIWSNSPMEIYLYVFHFVMYLQWRSLNDSHLKELHVNTPKSSHFENSHIIGDIGDSAWIIRIFDKTRIIHSQAPKNIHWKDRFMSAKCQLDDPKLGGGFKYFLYFSPRKLGKWSNLTNIFQMGWNHQLTNYDHFSM